MASDPDDERPAARPVSKPQTHAIGQDVALLSVDELGERIAELRLEIERLERAKAVKLASREAAAAVFKL